MSPSPDHLQRKPVEIKFLVLDESTMLTVASVLDPLRAANRLSSTPLFSWQIFSHQGDPIRLMGDFQMKADGAFSNAKSGDYLIIVASFNQHKHANIQLIQELRKMKGRFKIICGVEAGTWLLARANIATNHSVTTHWEDIEQFRLSYPDLDVKPDRYVIDKSVWTCGGASPALDMMLHLIEREYGRSLALETASVFIYDQTHASTDSQPTVSLGKLESTEPRITTAVRLMEKNIDTPLSVSTIARRIGISSKTLELIFRKHLSETPGRYYLRLRLNAARKLVLDSGLSIQEISILCGFESQSAFSRSFRNHHGSSPLSFRRKP